MRLTFETPRGQLRVQRVMAALATQPMTCAQMAESLHMAITTARGVVRHLHGQKQIFVSGWVATGFTWAAIYSPGARPDKPRPQGTDVRIRKRQFKKRLKKDMDRYDRYLAKQRSYYWIAKHLGKRPGQEV